MILCVHVCMWHCANVHVCETTGQEHCLGGWDHRTTSASDVSPITSRLPSAQNLLSRPFGKLSKSPQVCTDFREALVLHLLHSAHGQADWVGEIRRLEWAAPCYLWRSKGFAIREQSTTAALLHKERTSRQTNKQNHKQAHTGTQTHWHIITNKMRQPKSWKDKK